MSMNPAIKSAIDEQLNQLRTNAAFFESRAAQLRAEADECDIKKADAEAQIADLEGAIG